MPISETAILLKAARQLAGFKSARAAALAFSWPESLYAAHEGGSRRPSQEQMNRYLNAFAVDPAQLRRATRHGASGIHQTGAVDEKRRRARRLTLARNLAGFATAKAAANTYGLNEQNYYSHESGRHGISDQLAAVYGLAFGVSPRWLQTGEGPSGLTNEDTEVLASAIDAFVESEDAPIPENLIQFASAARRASPEAVDELRSKKRSFTTLPKATTIAGDALEIVREGIDEGRSNAWGFPAGFLSRVWGLSPSNLRVVALSAPPNGTVNLGDRVLIDADDLSFVDGAEMALRGEGGTIISSTSMPASDAGFEVLGRVVARISRVC